MRRRLCLECDGEGRYEVTCRFDALQGRLVYDVVDCPACGARGWIDVPRRVGAIHWILGALLVWLLLIAIVGTSRSGQTTDRPDMSPISSAALSGAPRPVAVIPAGKGTPSKAWSAQPSGNLPRVEARP